MGMEPTFGQMVRHTKASGRKGSSKGLDTSLYHKVSRTTHSPFEKEFGFQESGFRGLKRN